jgi:hypothetical protein
MKHPLRTALLAVCVVLATLPGSRSISGNLSFRVHTPADRVNLTALGNGTTAVDITAAGRDNVARISDEGQPALPYRIVQFLLPRGTVVDGVEATLNSGERVLREVFRPQWASPEVIPDAPRERPEPALAPAGGTAFPARSVRYLGTGTWHGRSIASFAVFPVRVVDGALALAPDITVTVRTRHGSDSGASSARMQRVSRARAQSVERALAAVVVNPEMGATYESLPVTPPPAGGFQPTVAPSLEGSPVEYVIITTTALASSYERLANWRTARGTPTVVRTTEWIEQNYRHGSDVQETIRTFIRDAYEKWSTTYFLLGGDTSEIPPRYLYTTYYYGGTLIPADIYFEGLDGTWNEDHDDVFGENPVDVPDVYTEVHVNRLPTSTAADVDLMIDKILSYETAVHPEWGQKMLMLAEVLFPTNWQPGQTIQDNGADVTELIRSKHLNDTNMQVARLYQTDDLYPGSYPESRAATLDSMNAGFNHIFHVGHGYRFNLHVADANVTIPDADALVNNDRFFNLYMLNCTANAFDFDCLGEHFLMNPTGGAVSAMGSSNSAFATAATYYTDKYTEVVFDDDVVRIGAAHSASRLGRTPIAILTDNADYWTHLIYASLADPAMQMFNDPVQTLQVTHPDTILAGVAAFDVTVTSEGVPQDSAVVCIWKGTEDYQVVPTDGLGVASFSFASETPGSLSVVVTGHNRGAYTGTIRAVAAPGAYLAFSGATVDDDSLGGTFGNGDGVIDAGETVDLTPQASNTGTSASQAATMTISTANPAVTVVDAVASLPALGAGQTDDAGDAWRITVSALAGDGEVCDFDIAIADGIGNWDDVFARVLHAPVLEFVTVRADDSALGNNDGTIQNLEPVHLYYALKNYGTGAAYGLDATVVDGGLGGVNVSVGTASYPDIGPLEEAENASGFVVSEVNAAVENPITITVTDRYGRPVSDTFELRPPDPPSDLSFDASLGEDRIAVAWIGSPSTDVDRYRLYRSTTPGGPYTLATADPVLHTLYTDVGLTANTRYYYVATAVDTSGNESTPSAESSASTNPQQAEGWPNVLADPSSNSVIAGDIDADQNLEVIVGNDFLYAWHHDGQEVRDGDGEALTYGIFSNQGGGFIGPAALAKIDSDFGLDIIAASWSTYEVYIFNRTGSVIPGWPRPTVDRVRAGMVVGDIDGDDDPEIVAVDQDAYLYVWHSDGTEYRDGDSNPATDGVFYRLPDTPWWHYQSPCLADIDHDGEDEIIIGTHDQKVYVFNEDGSSPPGWPLALSAAAGGGIAVGDIDNNGDLDLVVPVTSSEIMALRPDASILWIRWFPQNLFFNPSPALADIDNNGTLETFLPSSNGLLYGIASNGANLPGWPVTYSTSTNTESSPVIADVSGDGVVDILLGDESKFIYGWDIGGNPLDGFPLVIQDAVRGTPAIADLDRDGTVEIIAAGYDRTVYVWDLSAPYDAQKAPWPMKGANMHRSGVYGYIVPTAVGAVAFSHQFGAGSVTARWDDIPQILGSVFDVDRATIRDGQQGPFTRLATGVRPILGRVEVVDADVHMGDRYVYRLVPETGEGIESAAVRIPVTRAGLEQNYPNPFNPTTTIVFYVPEMSDAATQRVSLAVYDVTGARVRTLVDRSVAPGRYTLQWDGTNDAGNRVGSGVYFYRIVQPGFQATKKMVLLK